jgi:hypothetical protein
MASSENGEECPDCKLDLAPDRNDRESAEVRQVTFVSLSSTNLIPSLTFIVLCVVT